MRHARTGSRGLRWSIYGAAAVVALLLLNIDDWSRDFVSTHAEISAGAPESLRPFASTLPGDDLGLAVRWAAKRIGSWEFVGDAVEGRDRVLLFVRTSPLLRLRDDILVRIEDRGHERVVTAVSEGRVAIGDLGRNPRNLRRLLVELRDVLDGASSRRAAPVRSETGRRRSAPLARAA
ncbi:MAG TPA: DUF1499 domain-containing protein [Candidatus Polarisedimenticolaceae bacterium]|nr:DUF1499 domain-containing protein [Candidatus Polarisedimenticolaceae bacterium]